MSDMFNELESTEYQDHSNFDTTYNDEQDFISEYEEMMESIDDPEPIDIMPVYDEDTNFYQAVDNWDNEYEEPITERLTGKGKRSYNRFKEDENEFKKEFAEELTMLYDLLDEVNKFNKKLDKKYDSIDGSKAKGTSKYLNDLITSILNSKTTKLQILKEITGVKKTIQDLKMKSDGKNSQNAGNGSLESSANSYFREIMKVGRNSFIDAISEDSFTETEYSNNEDIEYANSLPDAHGELQNRIAERLESEGYARRTDEGDKYIRYENLKVDIVIKYNILNNDWEVIAVDSNGQQVIDYPVPTRQDLGKVKFSTDHKYATDKFGRSYKVLEVCGS